MVGSSDAPPGNRNGRRSTLFWLEFERIFVHRPKIRDVVSNNEKPRQGFAVGPPRLQGMVHTTPLTRRRAVDNCRMRSSLCRMR